MLRFAANLTTLFNEVPFLDRFARAAEAGFSAVEFLDPCGADVNTIKRRIDDLGLEVVLLNLHPGDAELGEEGTMANPARQDHFRWSLTSALEMAKRLKCRLIHTMCGNRIADIDREVQIATAVENLVWAAPQAAQAGVTLLLEALNPFDFPDYLLHDSQAALDIVTRVAHPHCRLQFDAYHAQMTRGDLISSITAYFPHIAHIQISDVPGRHEPGTGEINYPAVFAALERLGYQGFIGLEYRPSSTTEESLSWLPRDARGGRPG